MGKIVNSDEHLKITRQILNLKMVERTTLNPDEKIKDEIMHMREELVKLKMEEKKKEGMNNDQHKRR